MVQWTKIEEQRGSNLCCINGYFEELDKSHYKVGITALEYRYEKCIRLCGDYIEK